jgi:futalosine hydrolase
VPAVLLVTAVAVELHAVLAEVPARSRRALVGLVGGIGPVAAAVSTAGALARLDRAVGLVVSIGIAGGFAGRAGIGSTVLGTSSVFADLGAATDEGFLDLRGLGLGVDVTLTSTADADLVGGLAARTDAGTGTVLTLATMTGTDSRAAELAAAHPGALAEAMEGHGVAAAAAAAGVPWLEVRTISNVVGRRDRAAWDLPAALSALRIAGAALGDLTGDL